MRNNVTGLVIGCKIFRTAKHTKSAKKTFFNFAFLAHFAVRLPFSGWPVK